MLRIQKAQMTVLSLVAIEDFVERVRDHLRETQPGRAGPLRDEAIDALTRQAIERAPRYGLVSEADVARFTELLLDLGSSFDLGPNAQAVLTDPALSPDARLAAVVALHRSPETPELAP